MRKIVQSYEKKTIEQYDRDHMVCYLNERQVEIPAKEEGQEPQEVFEYDEMVVDGLQVSKQVIVAALVADGEDELSAAVMASELLLRACQQGVISGDALALAKEYVCDKITAYDSSSAVNEFTFGGKTMWLDDAMRTKLAKRFDTDELDGKTDTKLIYEGESYDLPITTARAMLHQIESYARDCFDKTNEHTAAVSALTTVKKVLAYDYTKGYPQKLSFEI